MRVRYHPEAEAELDEALAWYFQAHPSLSAALLEDVVIGERAIAERPKAEGLATTRARRAGVLVASISLRDDLSRFGFDNCGVRAGAHAAPTGLLGEACIVIWPYRRSLITVHFSPLSFHLLFRSTQHCTFGGKP